MNVALTRSAQDGTLTEIDNTLARIVTEQESSLGINNITVCADLDDQGTVPFQANGSADELSFDRPDYYIHDDFLQSTPTIRGQFENFVPPGNLNSTDQDGTFSSTTGITFEFMRNFIRKLFDTISSGDASAMALSNSNPEIDTSHLAPTR